MATLQTSDFVTLVRSMVTAVQGGATTLLNLSVGSVLRAIIEAVAAITLWLQGLITYVLTLTRAATSTGADLDSFYADYSFSRLGAVAATGLVTFSRFTATAPASVPVGSVVQTSDGTQSFTVTANTGNAAYNATANAYLLATSVSSVTVPVVAANLGSQGNVLAGSISSIGQSLPGIDTVTNGAAFINGLDAETDTAYRARFPLYLASLSKATKAAIEAAIEGIQQGIQVTVTENVNYAGASDPGYFYVVVDDGTGSPSTTLLGLAGTAVEAVRGLSITYGIFAPTVITATPQMVLTTATGYNHSTVIGLVTAALQNFINGLGLGNPLPYTQLASVAYGIAGVTNVSGVLLNGGTSDIGATPQQTIKCGIPVIS